MFCFRYRKLLIPYSEGSLSPALAERLRRHLASCARCSEEFSAVSVTAQALRRAEMPAMEPAGDLWSRVRGSIENQPEPRPAWRLGSLQAASAGVVAAVLLCFILIQLPYQPAERSKTLETPAASKQRPEETLRLSEKPGAPARARAMRRVAPAPLRKELKFEARKDTSPNPLYGLVPQAPAAAPVYRPAEPGVVGFSTPTTPVPSRAKAKDGDVKFYGYLSPSENVYSNPSTTTAPASPKPLNDTKGSADMDNSIVTRAPAPPASAGAAVSPEKAASAGAEDESKLRVTGRIQNNPAKVERFEFKNDYYDKLKETQSDVQTLTKLAEADEKRGDKAGVVKWRRKLIEVCPKDATRWVDLGRAHEANSQPAEAIAAYRQAISLGLKGNLEAEVNGRIRKLTESLKAPASSGR